MWTVIGFFAVIVLVAFGTGLFVGLYIRRPAEPATRETESPVAPRSEAASGRQTAPRVSIPPKSTEVAAPPPVAVLGLNAVPSFGNPEQMFFRPVDWPGGMRCSDVSCPERGIFYPGEPLWVVPLMRDDVEAGAVGFHLGCVPSFAEQAIS